MMPDQSGPGEIAFEVYRLAWSEVQELQKSPQPQRVEFYIEEMKEVLLDLKQATIANDQALAQRYISEALSLLVELRNASPGE